MKWFLKEEGGPLNCTGTATDGAVAGLGGNNGTLGVWPRRRRKVAPPVLKRRKVVGESRVAGVRSLILDHTDYVAVKMDCQDGSFKFEDVSPDHTGPLAVESSLTGERFFVAYV